MSERLPEVGRQSVNDETMAAVRRKYEVLDRIIKNPQYDGKAIKSESWEAFQEIRLLRRALAAARTELDRHGHGDMHYTPEGWRDPKVLAAMAAIDEVLGSDDQEVRRG